MKLAVMQPYLFPYIGYFQLIYASDLFLIYDDVAYIKQGYINRNNIYSANGIMRFTIPVPRASSNKLIADLEFSSDTGKFLKSIEQSYSKAPYFKKIFPLVQQVMEQEDRTIASVCLKSYQAIFLLLGLDKKFKMTSRLDYDRTVLARDRLIGFCHKFGANCYINAPGGRSLYDKRYFSEQGVDLKFMDSLPVKYSQNSNEFIPNLSIIDVLMNCSPDKVVCLMQQYEIN
tara:strand:+ start:714 stop:1403 length:690 start_codon:yes stop_codon:yes gene_type:complete